MSFISAAQLRAQRNQAVRPEPVAPCAVSDSEGPRFTCSAAPEESAMLRQAQHERSVEVGAEPTEVSARAEAQHERSGEGKALVTQDHFTDTTATSPQGHHTVLTPLAQGLFLESLAGRGNVRLACRAAGISPQTVYRARRRSAGFARAWDAALVSARVVAEEALADRALDGWEEPVFYHGEEIARRRRFSDRLLLAHLARLDALAQKLEAGEGAEEAMAALDDQIDALKRGEELPEPEKSHSAYPEPVEGLHSTSGEGCQGKAALRQAQGERDSLDQDPVPCVPSCRVPPSSSPKQEGAAGQQKACEDCGGSCDDRQAELGPEDCQWLGNRIARMSAARPKDAPKTYLMADGLDETSEIEALQLEAFEAGGNEWWLVTNHAELMASCAHGYDETGGDLTASQS